MYPYLESARVRLSKFASQGGHRSGREAARSRAAVARAAALQAARADAHLRRVGARRLRLHLSAGRSSRPPAGATAGADRRGAAAAAVAVAARQVPIPAERVHLLSLLGAQLGHSASQMRVRQTRESRRRWPLGARGPQAIAAARGLERRQRRVRAQLGAGRHHQLPGALAGAAIPKRRQLALQQSGARRSLCLCGPQRRPPAQLIRH